MPKLTLTFEPLTQNQWGSSSHIPQLTYEVWKWLGKNCSRYRVHKVLYTDLDLWPVTQNQYGSSSHHPQLTYEVWKWLETRAPRGTDRSPEYNEHFCYKLDSRVKNFTTEWNQKQQHFITHASRSLLWIRFVSVAFRSPPPPPPCDLFCLTLDLLLGEYGQNIFMHVQGHEHFIHTKFRNYSWSGSVVKLVICSHTCTCISAPPLFIY